MFHYRDDPEYRTAELNLLNQSILTPNIYFSKFIFDSMCRKWGLSDKTLIDKLCANKILIPYGDKYSIMPLNAELTVDILDDYIRLFRIRESEEEVNALNLVAYFLENHKNLTNNDIKNLVYCANKYQVTSLLKIYGVLSYEPTLLDDFYAEEKVNTGNLSSRDLLTILKEAEKKL